MTATAPPRARAAGAPLRRPRTLAQAYDPRGNAFDVLRLALAGTVAVTHAMQLALGWQPTVGGTEVGELAVDGFFVLSGFLITSSWLRLDSPGRFAWHRALRILPGFWTCLLVTAVVVAPLLAVLGGGRAGDVLTGPGSATTYVLHNAGLFMAQFGIAGLPASTPDPVVNGSLWTLFYEALCYAAVAGLGVLGLLRRRPLLVVAGVGALQLATTAQVVTGVQLLPGENLPRLLLLFALGAAALLVADRVPVTPVALLVAGASLVAGLLLLDDYRALGAPGFALLLLAVAARLPWRPRLRRDLSYGAYVWHWPVALLVLSTPLAGAPFVVVLGVVLAATALAALASWHLVESPALRLKDVRSPLRRDSSGLHSGRRSFLR
ncbi:acyltransferase [Streptomyces sp. NP160]|uniref:acyltransferase family protein n=1 Tax=Streptomyces sp. NP160 TaxID=2586637 RepID=UPI001C562DD4|nr:acyltransferase [Streptomyces sp. NP160]